MSIIKLASDSENFNAKHIWAGRGIGAGLGAVIGGLPKSNYRLMNSGLGLLSGALIGGVASKLHQTNIYHKNHKNEAFFDSYVKLQNATPYEQNRINRKLLEMV
jgi:hypothetical protein